MVNRGELDITGTWKLQQKCLENYFIVRFHKKSRISPSSKRKETIRFLWNCYWHWKFFSKFKNIWNFSIQNFNFLIIYCKNFIWNDFLSGVFAQVSSVWLGEIPWFWHFVWITGSIQDIPYDSYRMVHTLVIFCWSNKT